MAITLSKSAAERVNTYLAKRGAGIGLRFGVKTTGCSGFAYVVDYADERHEADHVFESHGVKVFVDEKSLGYVNGTEIGFNKGDLGETFTFNNPNVKNSCGCGESFNV